MTASNAESLDSAAKSAHGRRASCIGRQATRSNIQAGNSSQRPVAPIPGAAQNDAVCFLDHIMDEHNAFSPGMPRIENLAISAVLVL